MDYLPDRVTYEVNPDIAAGHTLREYGIHVSSGWMGTVNLCVPLKIKAKRNWWGKKSHYVTYRRVVAWVRSNLHIQVWGNEYVQDAVELAGKLSKIYDQDIKVILESENPLREETEVLTGEQLANAINWLN